MFRYSIMQYEPLFVEGLNMRGIDNVAAAAAMLAACCAGGETKKT